MRLRHATLIALGSLVMLPACREAKVTTYRVPKEVTVSSAPTATNGSNPATTAVPTVHAGGMTWTAPSHWEARVPSAMRKGSYLFTGSDGTSIDISITAFPGDVGGELANINRWRGQIHLDPLPEAPSPSTTTSLRLNGLNFKIVELANLELEHPQRILGAMVSFEGNTWFFKLMGPDTLVAAEKPSFLAFLQTVKSHRQ